MIFPTFVLTLFECKGLNQIFFCIFFIIILSHNCYRYVIIMIIMGMNLIVIIMVVIMILVIIIIYVIIVEILNFEPSFKL